MQNQLENKAYANFFVRLVAFLIDSLLAGMVVGMVKMPLSFAAMAGADFLSKNFIFEYSVLDILSYSGVALYFVLMTYFSHATVGKMLLGLEVITVDGEWKFINILYRETIGRFLSSLFCIGYIVILTKEDHQGFHDMLCDTYVVYKNLIPKAKDVNLKSNKNAEEVVENNIENVEVPQQPVVEEMVSHAQPNNIQNI